ncbi:hypothetical protein L7F22_063542 [Adiantum nelumboides]|nr:hypothetical protein [Adiantum nelumboides]
MSIVARQSAASSGREFDAEADERNRAAVEAQIEQESHAFFVTARLYDDGVIDPRDTRTVLGIALSTAHSNIVAGRVATASSGCEAADEAVRLPGAAPSETYLRADLIIEAALLTGADAIHPGYGFLSENADFARACAAAGITFVGPPVEAIEAMGSKIAAKELMEKAGVPVLPGATIDDARTGRRRRRLRPGRRHRLPAAGEGRLRRWRARHAHRPLRPRCRRRDGPGARPRRLGDGTVFLERFVEDPRHVEVQIFGDTHGTVVHLFERGSARSSAATRRSWRNAPSPAVDDALRTRSGTPSPRARRSATPAPGPSSSSWRRTASFFFLEVNTRLQSSTRSPRRSPASTWWHCRSRSPRASRCPRRSTGPRSPATRSRPGSTPRTRPGLPARLGDPHRFSVPALPGVRVDTGGAGRFGGRDALRPDAGEGDRARPHPHRGRPEARPGRCPRPRSTARSPTGTCSSPSCASRSSWRADRHRLPHPPRAHRTRRPSGGVPPSPCTPSPPPWPTRRAAGRAPRPAAGPSGWRNVRSAAQHAEYRAGDTDLDVTYRLGRGTLDAGVNGTALRARPCRRHRGPVDLQVGGVRRAVRVHRVGDTVHVDSALGATTLTERARCPSPAPTPPPARCSPPCPAPSSGSRPGRAAGRAGAVVVVFEAMKMEHLVRAPVAGTVAELGVQVGDTVESGEVLAVIEEAQA